jgi:hypothetical protein
MTGKTMARARKRTAKSGRTVRILLLTRTDGEIIGGALRDERGGGIRADIHPLPGQVLHEVDVPENLVRVRSARELYTALSAYRVEPVVSRLVSRYPQAVQRDQPRPRRRRTRRAARS